ncbi:3',5'-cyclic adenosine monophosphate phosphodiesterase CpdA [Enhygromyxa salina]|uniref:3',5'-cyclic adenosine monophosphate phosphodiesterase CpdA n=1 Tax=Enhygromyxa salina TaxID=215803 RepID=A0A2S9YAZ2_9BACT|nr:metallophosphoesterase [Enhygromyxa salina]PRQ02280.1 3',5'-cyclic adenosine monophosphate phosphodiesterase CpdA [Enhygromyxa salina]
MARDIYNFIWTLPPPPGPTIGPVPQRSMATVAARHASTRGVILYPAFMTPLVYIEGQEAEPWLELLIATEHPLTRAMVNAQLKISAGLRSEKPVSTAPLFTSATGNIIVESAGEVSDDGETIIETHSKFAGILHPSFGEALRDKRVRRVYRVKIQATAIPYVAPTGELNYSFLERKWTDYAMRDGAVTRLTRRARVGRELSDLMIREMLTRRFGPDNRSNQNSIPGRGRYAFPMHGNTVDIRKVDPEQPIQSYHPMVVMTGDDAHAHVNLGHVSDIHINTRWQILGKSNARVIEYGAGQYEDESPEIGSLLAENNRSFHAVLGRLAGSEADAIIVGGDVVDHIRNAYDPGCVLRSDSTPRQIWDAMNIEGDAYTDATYPVGLDLIAFFSFMYEAMTVHQKPVFGITGNHDCYVDAFGISPRLNAELTASRTNEGIPADLNLTFYEALLAFGPSAGLLRSASSSFDADWFDWFHLVLTPFNDWWFKFPNQSLVGLGWGTTEDLIDPFGGQSGGHLPRSDDAISDAQLALLQRAVDERGDRKVTLTSHFTFLSYIESVPMHPGGARSSRGTFRLNENTLGTESYSHFEMGTFETNRATLMNMLAGRQLQCVLTGHSHRRGLHLLGDRNGDEIPADLFDTDPRDPLSLCRIPAGLTAAEPAIIVSDSGGPYPRHNRDNEFLGWGSDRPGGTLVRFDRADGRLTDVRTLTATRRRKARGAVVMDYVDVSSEGVFNDNRMQTQWVPADVDSGAAPASASPVWFIDANLTTQVHSTWGMYIEKIIFAGRHGDRWIHVESTYDRAHNAFAVPAAQTDDFRTWARLVLQPTRYVSIKMGSRNGFISGRYGWGSHWNFEVFAQPIFQHQPDARGRMVRFVSYRIFRPQREIAITGRDVAWREAPNFDWRMANDPKYAD